MEIRNINKFVLKHAGLTLLFVGALMTFLQFCGLNQMFPLSVVIYIISLIFQFIGWNEPFVLLVTKKESGR